jgi:NAD(P)-dependent dehydrogenase (short-subunit alcohol dehydrogenase family)
VTAHRVCITGAASGIGRAAAARFAAAGDSLILVDRRPDDLREVAAGLRDTADTATEVCDVRHEAQVREVFARAAEAGPLDCLVLCAGVTSDGFIETTTEHDWSYVLATNLTGTFLCLKYAVPLLRGAPAGSVVAVGSVSAHVVGAGGGCAAYEASKAGLVQLVRAFAVEHADDGIRANVVSPGRVRTNLGPHTRELRATVYTSPPGYERPRYPIRGPLRPEGTPEEIAEAIYFLGGPAAGFITGAELVVDGGYTII